MDLGNRPVASSASDVAILLVYGALIVAMLVRFFRTRRAPTFVLASLPLGWVLASLWDLGILRPNVFGLFRWAGVALGAYILVTLRPMFSTPK